jgi:hypothetical protein
MGAAEPGAGAGGAEQQQDPGAAQPAPEGAAPQAEMKEVEGKISKIDPQGKMLKVGGLAGLFGTDLHVTDQTKFVPGPGVPSVDFSSLKEGDRIRASYQKMGDRNVANEIVVLTPTEQAPAGAAPEQGAPGAGGAGGAGGGAGQGGTESPSQGPSGPSY